MAPHSYRTAYRHMAEFFFFFFFLKKKKGEGGGVFCGGGGGGGAGCGVGGGGGHGCGWVGGGWGGAFVNRWSFFFTCPGASRYRTGIPTLLSRKRSFHS